MQSLYSGLLSYFPLNHYSSVGDTVTDMVGNRSPLDGSAGANAIVTGPGGVAISFPGGAPAFVNGDDVAYNLGDTLYTIALWVYLSDAALAHIAVAKYRSVAGDKDYQVYFNASDNRFKFQVYQPVDTVIEVAADTLGAPDLNRWYFLHIYRDAVADEIAIRVNLGAFDIAAPGGAMQSNTAADFEIGTRNQGDFKWNGRLVNLGIWARRLVEVEHAWLYNQGRGRNWPLGDGRYMPLAHNRRLRRRRIA